MGISAGDVASAVGVGSGGCWSLAELLVRTDSSGGRAELLLIMVDGRASVAMSEKDDINAGADDTITCSVYKRLRLF